MKKDLINMLRFYNLFKILVVYHVNESIFNIILWLIPVMYEDWSILRLQSGPDLSVQYFGVFIEYFQFISVIS